MCNFKLSTPVAFIIFNRPDTTEMVFSEIAKAKPVKLLIIGDGPRSNRAGEDKKVAASREIVKKIDWECEVLTNYSDTNLGCKLRVSSGIDWIFEQVEECIILEDDCLPDPSFFEYCQQLLEKYRHDDRVMAVSGDNFQFGKQITEYSYYFSRYNHIWGWATWRRAWSKYDVSVKLWPEVKAGNWMGVFSLDADSERYWYGSFEDVYRNRIDTWDYQWTFACWVNNGLTILPRVNLISNIGFNEQATHTKSQSIFSEMETKEIEFPLQHPRFMLRHAEADRRTDKLMFYRPLWKRLALKIRNYLVKHSNG